ncbi:MAG: TIGR02281 family clan AA aspartic protease [Gammaproteobacteria bacterium]|nr:TIGR02281 family clan AA aspartic protease [Gammaproteobacteria bacterium]
MIVAMWVIVLWLLTMFFVKWAERDHNMNQRVESVVGADGVREIALLRNRNGHYVTSGAINSYPVVFMIDTGASDISIPYRVADKIGLKRGAQKIYRTANGPALNYSTQLAKVGIGDIELENVRASINPNVEGTDILLGMTFLKHLEFSQRGDTLTLRQYP